MTKTMNERFEDTRCFITPNVSIEKVYALDREGIKYELQEINLQSEIDLAKEEERKRIVEIIEKILSITPSSYEMAGFAYNIDNPKYNGLGEPPSMICEMSEKQFKLWHIKEYINYKIQNFIKDLLTLITNEKRY